LRGVEQVHLHDEDVLAEDRRPEDEGAAGGFAIGVLIQMMAVNESLSQCTGQRAGALGSAHSVHACFLV
jgi:hypothetical protein